MLRVWTGRCRSLEAALLQGVGGALKETNRDQWIVVPKQLTLQTEMLLLNRLNLAGSFRIRVLSPERLCQRIFSAAGMPSGQMVDDKGRVLLAREAIKAAEESLTVYRGAYDRRGFAQRAARQIEMLRQAGISPAELSLRAESATGQTALKLRDLSAMLSAYEQRLGDRFQDGEAQFQAAASRAERADFLKTSDVWLYGFDLTPPALTEFMACLGGVCPRATLLFPMESDPAARDRGVFVPLAKAYTRLVACANQRAVPVECAKLPRESFRNPELAHLEAELFAIPSKIWPQDQPLKGIQLAALRNPREEARFVAALVRRLCQTRGMRYNDIAILCQDVDNCALCLEEAFADFDIPLFLSTHRPASRHALAEFLLTALRLLSHSFRADDILAYLETGYTDLIQDEADRLVNYVVRWGIRGKAFLKPFSRGLPEEAQAMEPLRRQLTEPLAALQGNLKDASDLKEQLQAIFRFLTDTDAYAKTLSRQNALAEAGQRQAANELGQVWNRILETMDQMVALMGEKKLPLRELGQILGEALDAAIVKPLPQSEDAVYAQGTDRALHQQVRALILMGMTDRPVSEDEGLLTDAQRRSLADATGAYLGPDGDDAANMRRFALKCSMDMVEDYVCCTYSFSGLDGAAQRPSATVGMLRWVFPALGERGGLLEDASMVRLMESAPKAALKHLSCSLDKLEEEAPLAAALADIPSARPKLAALFRALCHSDAAQSLNPLTAARLYGEIEKISITRLERYASCPYSYFTQYGLRPERVEPYAFRPRDEGAFLHDAIGEFVGSVRGELGNLSQETAQAQMDQVSDRLLDVMAEGPLGDTAVSLAQRRRLKDTARAAAAAMVSHMQGSAFAPAAVEVSFGPEDAGALRLELPDGPVALEGRIDRVDTWDSGGYLRILDYKRGGKKLNLWEVYCGLQLQLMVYLAVATAQHREHSAGAYYFTLDEGILSTQSTDPAQVERERGKRFRMNGILPNDTNLLAAMSPNYPQVFSGNFTKAGEPYQNTPTAQPEDFRRLTKKALDMAKRHVGSIRSGLSNAAPVLSEGQSACKYCAWRAACLFDPGISPQDVRRMRPMKNDEVLKRLAVEEE